MLLVDGSSLDKAGQGDFTGAVLANSSLTARSKTFLCSPRQPANSPQKTIIVLQCEVAHCAGEDVVVASYGATTCCIIAVGEACSKRISLAHIDGSILKAEAGLEELLHQVGSWQDEPSGGRVWVQEMAHAEMYIMGAFSSSDGCGMCEHVLTYFHNHPAHLHLELACVGAANTSPNGAPACQDFAFDACTWVCFRGTFGDHGPQLDARFARCFTSNYMAGGLGLLPIYDAATGCMFIPPLYYQEALPSWLTNTFMGYLGMSDEELVWNTSTSPEYEAPMFVPETRAALKWVLQHSRPLTSQGGPTVYQWRSGVGWTPGMDVPMALEAQLL